ncbi:MAG: hypothetical protein J6Y16_02770 [Treponema sp.]|nr:hypothetical protein [Treponema sp.]
MKKLVLNLCLAFFTLCIFAIDYDKVSTRILPTLTDDELFIGQCANEKELTMLLEKGFKYTFNKTLDNADNITEKILSRMENKKIYNKEFELAGRQHETLDVWVKDENHVGFDFDEIVQVINTFKSKLEKSSGRYYVVCMKDRYGGGYLMVYDAKKKEVFLQHGSISAYRSDKFFSFEND